MEFCSNCWLVDSIRCKERVKIHQNEETKLYKSKKINRCRAKDQTDIIFRDNSTINCVRSSFIAFKDEGDVSSQVRVHRNHFNDNTDRRLYSSESVPNEFPLRVWRPRMDWSSENLSTNLQSISNGSHNNEFVASDKSTYATESSKLKIVAVEKVIARDVSRYCRATTNSISNQFSISE